MATQARPYPFIAFEQYIQKTARQYTDTGGTRDNLDKVNTELLDVHVRLKRSPAMHANHSIPCGRRPRIQKRIANKLMAAPILTENHG